MILDGSITTKSLDHARDWEVCYIFRKDSPNHENNLSYSIGVKIKRHYLRNIKERYKIKKKTGMHGSSGTNIDGWQDKAFLKKWGPIHGLWR